MALQVHLVLEPHGPATAIILTDDQVEQLGGGKRAAVLVTVDGRRVRLRLGVMGGINMIGLSKAARADLGVEIGDEIDATIELDADARTVEVPDDLAAALTQSGLRETFDAKSFTYRKEAARGVADAKRPDTRQRRIDKVVADLS
ncbi:DUF1905 domain-containing protein [Gordonia sp. TBRC 11910]|uniref:DUF1905 domain-containing protein n=1 Tax=Gordonia asplenii TaxID=2725283 RepID=A0A848KQI0_9ACTN|nr:YdeI/OmpD-associated family protein [Gordonia asplenii]NMO00197.1 DUF1905 domain-containing protein [Gordonia asplenii]